MSQLSLLQSHRHREWWPRTRLFVVCLAAAFALTGCLQLSPNVETEMSEVEARVALEDEVRDLCDHKKSRLRLILESIDASEAEATSDHWIFRIDDREALIFPSGVAAGDYFRYVQSSVCR